MLERLEKLLADATPGPWVCEGRGSLQMDGSRDYWEVHGPHDGERWAKVCSTCPPAHRNPQNLKLIAAAVNALPALLAVVEAARKLSGAATLSQDDCMSTVHTDYVDELEIALAKLDEVASDA